MTESLFAVQDDLRLPYQSPGEATDRYLRRLVDALRLTLRELSIQHNNTAMGIVENYAALPAATRPEVEGRIYYLRDGTGPPAGNWFGSDGTSWILLG